MLSLHIPTLSEKSMLQKAFPGGLTYMREAVMEDIELRTSRDVGMLRHMMIVALNYCASCPDLH